MNKKILCVDDEPHILEALKRVFRKEFEIYVAEGGEQALAILEREGDFAVIVSDMRMPGMSGVEFLHRAREIAPDTVRIMLTGDAEQLTAMTAVNEGEIFRFLTKPCASEAFGKAVSAAVRQYGLVTLEKVLLEKTLAKSLQVLVDILAVVNPTAFSRASRVKRLARDIAERVGDCDIWEIEIAAMLSQIGCVAVPEEILSKIARGEPLEDHEAAIYRQHPQVGRSLIADIPRMETIAEIIAHQDRRVSDDLQSIHEAVNPNVATKCAHILKIALDFDKTLELGKSPHETLRELQMRDNWYDAAALSALEKLVDQKHDECVHKMIDASCLEFGMIINETMLIGDDWLIERGTEVTFSVLTKLERYADRLPPRIAVKIPVNRGSHDALPMLAGNAPERAFA